MFSHLMNVASQPRYIMNSPSISSDTELNARVWPAEETAFTTHNLGDRVPLRSGVRSTSHSTRTPTTVLRQKFAAAQLALGQQMYAQGIDDGSLSEQIALVEAEIGAASVEGQPTKHLRLRRETLLRQLADAALVDDAPLPGSQEEFDRAWQALLACESALCV